MKIVTDAEIIRNEQLVDKVYDMTVCAPEIFDGRCALPIAGQFVGLYVGTGEHLLPRPISICDTEPSSGLIRLVYQVAGQGTSHFAGLKPGLRIRMIGPLGNGYSPAESGDHWLIGGGIGTPPLLRLAKTLHEREGCSSGRVFTVLGFRDAALLTDDFMPYCDGMWVATDNGKYGFHGNAVQLTRQKTREIYDGIPTAATFYACGPRVMLRALATWASENSLTSQISMEERMACGVGACMGCVVTLKEKDTFVYKRVCKDGPVFDGGQVVL